MQEHLQTVPDLEPESGQDTTEIQRQRAPKRPRTSRPLPTDRLKFDMQVSALKAIAVASNYGERGVSAEDIAPRIGVSAATAGLNNAFFLEAGLISRERKGHYVPTDATSEFARKATFNETEAATLLSSSFKDTWYYSEVAQQLAMGPTTHEQMTRVLAHSAGASKDHETQLANVLAWLEFVGLVVLFDGKVQLGQRDLQDLEEKPQIEPEKVGSGTPESTASERATKPPKQSQSPPGGAVLSLSFDLALTADDLRALSPEQITTLFEAVGRVAAVKATMT